MPLRLAHEREAERLGASLRPRQEISVPSQAVVGCLACLAAWDVELPARLAAGDFGFRAGEASADGLPGGLAVAIRASRPDHPSRNPVSR